MENNRQEVDTLVKVFHLMDTINSNVLETNKEIVSLKVNIEKNNVILDQHHMRSTNLELIVDDIRLSLSKLSEKITAINTNVKRIDADFEPVEHHVRKMERWIDMVSGVPAFFKIILWLSVSASSMYGSYSLFVKLLK